MQPVTVEVFIGLLMKEKLSIPHSPETWLNMVVVFTWMEDQVIPTLQIPISHQTQLSKTVVL